MLRGSSSGLEGNLAPAQFAGAAEALGEVYQKPLRQLRSSYEATAANETQSWWCQGEALQVLGACLQRQSVAVLDGFLLECDARALAGFAAARHGANEFVDASVSCVPGSDRDDECASHSPPPPSDPACSVHVCVRACVRVYMRVNTKRTFPISK